MELESKLKRTSLPPEGSTGFSDEDDDSFIDDYENDFLSSESSDGKLQLFLRLNSFKSLKFPKFSSLHL